MSHPAAACHLLARDLAILRWVGRGGIAAESQLSGRFWPGCRAATARDRLRQLVKADYLARYICDERRPGEVVYTLKPCGRRLFSPDEQRTLQIGLPAAGVRRQQLVAQDAYEYLEQEAHAQGGRLVAWHGEAALRRALYRTARAGPRQAPAGPTEIPDAQVQIAGADGYTRTYDIEIDGQYHGQMLRKKLDAFGTGGHPTLWFCTAPARAAHIRQAVARYPNIRVISLT
jgi:hypothetical protein